MSTFTDIQAGTTASRAASYIPPLATVAPNGGANSPQTTASSTSFRNPNPTTPAFVEDYDWINNYLAIHKMSPTSYRYGYLVWFFIVLFVVIFAALHWTGSRGGVIGARWSKWSLRRRTWRKKAALQAIQKSRQPHRQPSSLPSNAQLLSLLILFIGPIVLCVAGPDYISPETKLWDFTHNLTRRSFDMNGFALETPWKPHDLFARGPPIASTATTRQPDFTITKTWWTSGGRAGIIAFALCPLVVLLALKAPPFAVLALPFVTQLHFDKLARLHRWAGRLLWFITLVHVILWTVQLTRDERKGGLKPGHAISYVLLYDKFIYGIIGFASMTLLTLLSLRPIRNAQYELFYVLHVLLVPATLVFSALHFPPMWWWCWSALAVWIAERLWRAGRMIWVNGLIGGPKAPAFARQPTGEKTALAGHMAVGSFGLQKTMTANSDYSKSPKGEQWEMNGLRRTPQSDGMPLPDFDFQRPRMTAHNSVNRDSWADSEYHVDGAIDHGDMTSYKRASRMSSYNPIPPTPGRTHGGAGSGSGSGSGGPTPPAFSRQPSNLSMTNTHQALPPSEQYLSSPVGFARCTLLSGRTVRMAFSTPRPFKWAPGQHVLLNVPAISRWTSHPFTIVSVCDERAGGTRGWEIVLLVRARKGFTLGLWNEVAKRASWGGHPGGEKSGVVTPTTTSSPSEPEGVLLRAYVDGPFGSASRAEWGAHATILIICGGSGISFGVSLLQYLSLCMSGRDCRTLGGRSKGFGSFLTGRVRFVWLIREYSHIQWCATEIRQCLERVPRHMLQVDLFVTNFAHKSQGMESVTDLGLPYGPDDPLAPPAPRFLKNDGSKRWSIASVDSVDSTNSISSQVDLHYANGGRVGSTGDAGYASGEGEDENEHVLDLTNFDGEDDTRSPGEAMFSMRLRKEGKLRRANTRKNRVAMQSRAALEQKVPSNPVYPPSTQPQPQGQGYALADQGYGGQVSSHSPPPTEHLVSPSPRASAYPPALRSLMSGTASESSSQRDPSPSVTPLSPPHPLYRPPSSYRGLGEEQPIMNEFSQPNTADLYNPGGNSRHSIAASLSSRAGSPPPGFRHVASHPRGGSDTFDRRSLAGESMHRLIHHGAGQAGPHSGHGHSQGHGDATMVELPMDPNDDLNIVAEMARPGKPRLDKILADEVEASLGSIAVACCGPTSLNAVVRKIVAAKIDPERISKGDRRGAITLVSEEFQW